MIRITIAILTVAISAALSWYTVEYCKFETPYIFIFLYWFLAFTCLAFTSSKKLTKLICLNLGVLFLALTLFEGYLWWNMTSTRSEMIYAIDGFMVESDILGYAPSKNYRGAVKKIRAGEVIYDAVYTINEHGLRVAPPHTEEDGEHDCILFFGGSITFGSGVEDQETMPYQVGIRSEGQYQIHNFSFPGYGPHQMLAAIEHGIVEGVVDCEVKHVIYQGMLGHIHRAVGLASWDQYGPKYVIQGGELRRKGNFSSNPIQRTAMKSLIYQNTRLNMIGEDDVDLYVGILTRSKELLSEKYPDSEFYLPFWVWNNPMDQQYLMVSQKLADNGLPIVEISDALIPMTPEYRFKDGHPTALAHNLMADHVLSMIGLENVAE